MTYPYYRFTQWLAQQSDCEEWFEWFKSLGQPVCIVRDNWNEDQRRVKPYSVWVVGKEAMSQDNYFYHKPNSEEMKGEVVLGGF